MGFNIASAIDSVLVVDDKKSEIETLIEELRKKSIQTEYINPAEIDYIDVKCGNTLIVLDFELIEGVGHKANIGKIRGILPKITENLKVYGIAFWSKHSEENFDEDMSKKLFDVLKSDIDKDISDKTLPNPPLYYVVIVDKLEYLNGTHDWSQFFKHFKEALAGNRTATYYYKWSYLMKESIHDVFAEFNEILSEYKYIDRDKIFAFLLYQLTISQLGYEDDNKAELAKSSFRALTSFVEDVIKRKTDCVTSDIFSGHNNNFNVSDIYGKKYQIQFNKAIAISQIGGCDKTIPLSSIAKINTALAFDFKADYAKDRFLSGNLYKQFEDFESILHIPEKIQLGSDDIKVILEVTPPCDVAQKNCKKPKFIEGVFLAYACDRNCKEFSKDQFYNFVNPVYYKGKIYCFVLDFNALHIKDIDNNYFIGRANNGLFADILQKYSSHISRLGVSFINNIKY